MDVFDTLLSKMTDGIDTVTLIVIIFWLFLRETFVLGKHYRAVVEERDMWREIALRNGNQSSQLLEHREAALAALEAIKKKAREGKS